MTGNYEFCNIELDDPCNRIWNFLFSTSYLPISTCSSLTLLDPPVTFAGWHAQDWSSSSPRWSTSSGCSDLIPVFESFVTRLFGLVMQHLLSGFDNYRSLSLIIRPWNLSSIFDVKTELLKFNELLDRLLNESFSHILSSTSTASLWFAR